MLFWTKWFGSGSNTSSRTDSRATTTASSGKGTSLPELYTIPTEVTEDSTASVLETLCRFKCGPGANYPDLICFEDELWIARIEHDYTHGRGHVPWGIAMLLAKARQEARTGRFLRRIDSCNGLSTIDS